MKPEMAPQKITSMITPVKQKSSQAIPNLLIFHDIVHVLCAFSATSKRMAGTTVQICQANPDSRGLYDDPGLSAKEGVAVLEAVISEAILHEGQNRRWRGAGRM